MSTTRHGPKSTEEQASPEELAAAQKAMSPKDLQGIMDGILNVSHEGKPGALGKVGPYDAYAMDFDTLRLHHTPDAMGVVDGTNYKVNPKIVPKNRIYVDSNLQQHEWPPVLTHEAVETHLMDKGWEYDKAHKVANHFERKIRTVTHPQPGQRPPQLGQQQPQGRPPQPPQVSRPPAPPQAQPDFGGMLPPMGGQ